MRTRTVVSYNPRVKSTIACHSGPSIHARLSVDERMAECRRALDTGKCVFVGDRWLPANMPQEELDTLIAEDNRRIEKNRRQREYSARIRAERRLEEMISSLPPWVQSKRYGRTAVVTKVNGNWHSVDYGKTYGRRHDIPLPVPGDFIIDTMFDLAAAVASKLPPSYNSAVVSRSPEFAKGPLPINPLDRTEVERRNRLRTERRKCNRRATCAGCPTSTDMRIAWDFRKEREHGTLHLGAMLLDLECYVDNSIVFEQLPTREKENQLDLPGHDDSVTDKPHHLLGARMGSFKIRGRNPGLRGWIRINCPELECHYKILMRYKAIATRLRQALELPDPVPLSAVLDSSIDIQILWKNGIQEQPRPTPKSDTPVTRFIWEHAAWEYDADDRLFRKNARYHSVLPFGGGFNNFNRVIERSRRDVINIISQESDNGTTSTKFSNPINVFTRRFHGQMTIMVKRIDAAVKLRELWWRETA